MKVILLQDVAKIGRRSKVVEVPDGYALNQLIPKKLAEAATPTNLKKVQKLQAELESGKVAEQDRFVAAKKALAEVTVKIATEVNEQGHAFKAVSPDSIAEAIVAAGIDVDAAMISVASPIKSVGEHTVTLELAGNKAPFTIEVTKK